MLSTEHEIGKLTVSEVAKRCRVTVQTVHHWIRNGVRKNGVMVKLEAEPFGGRWRVNEAALHEFSRRCDTRTWQEAAQKQEAERKQARRDQKRLQQKLDGE